MRQGFVGEALTRFLLVLFGISSALLLGELGIRALFPSTKGYYAYKPYLQITFEPSPDILPGIDGESRFCVDSKGIRGDELSDEQTYRILAIGGSTTQCLYLDQREMWTHLLQERINEKAQNHRVWVGNVGKSGLMTRHHILQMQYLLQQLPTIDAVIILTGINDLTRRLAQDVDYDPYFMEKPGFEDKLLAETFHVLPAGCNKILPYYKRTAIWHLARNIKYRFFASGHVQDREGQYHKKWRKHRKNAIAIRDTLLDLSSSLEEFSRNINTIIDIAEKNSVRLIMVTQPAMWSPSLSDSLKDLLWFGGIGKYSPGYEREYYSVEALADGMKMYNETLLKTCRMRQVECFDLASLVVNDDTIFYDDCHFNERGAEKVAGYIARYMLTCEPFSERIND